jgi:hypothetical protein
MACKLGGVNERGIHDINWVGFQASWFLSNLTSHVVWLTAGGSDPAAKS